MATITLPQPVLGSASVQADEFAISYWGPTQMSYRFVVQHNGRTVASIHEEWDGSLTVVPVGGDRVATTQNNRWTLRGALAVLRRSRG